MSSTEAAELTKLLENTFRFINISFINEFAILCDKLNLNVWEIIQAANTKPYGFTSFFPGPGIGGHCIPVDPLYLLWVAKQSGTNSQFIEISNKLNHDIIQYIADQIETISSDKNPRILIYGAAYKKILMMPENLLFFQLFKGWTILISTYPIMIPLSLKSLLTVKKCRVFL